MAASDRPSPRVLTEDDLARGESESAVRAMAGMFAGAFESRVRARAASSR